MSALVFTCPSTGRDIISGIHTDLESLSHVRQLPVSLFCPNCGKVHRLVAKDGRLIDNSLLTKTEARHPARL
jgi:predicted RNA-binding Zn-ribbon protein involved in translation (DUF1610 family)